MITEDLNEDIKISLTHKEAEMIWIGISNILHSPELSIKQVKILQELSDRLDEYCNT